jgi:glucose-1-phosphate thymidylyltransferase
MDHLSETSIRHAVLVCNHRFIHQFEQWRDGHQSSVNVQLLDNGVTSPDNRLGAVGDLHLALETLDVQEDFLVLHGDNLFTFSLNPILTAFHRQGNTLATFDVKEKARARRAGQVTCDKNGRIIAFVEKPSNPESTQVSIGIYALRAGIREAIGEYMTLGRPADRSGDLMTWMHRRAALFTFPIPRDEGLWFDIGTPIDYQQARHLFA